MTMTQLLVGEAGRGPIGTILASAGAAIAIVVAWTYHAGQIRDLRQQLEELKRPPAAAAPRASGKFVNKLYPERTSPFAVLTRDPGAVALSVFALLALVALSLGAVRGSGSTESTALRPEITGLKSGLDTVNARLAELSDSFSTLRDRATKVSNPAPAPVRRAKQAQGPNPKLATKQSSAIAPAPPPPILQP